MVGLLLVMLGCDADEDLTPTPEAFRGQADFTLDGSHAGSESISLGWVGWSHFLEDDFSVVAASDDEGVWDLVFAFEGALVQGEHTPDKVYLRKGEQLFLDAEATCTAALTGEGTTEAPFAAVLSCDDLVTEAGSPSHEDRPFSLVDGVISGGTVTNQDYRANRFTMDGWFGGLQLVSGPLEGDLVEFRDLDRAVVVPWREDGSWVLFEDGEDDSLDDAFFRVSPGDGSWTVERQARWGADPSTAVELAVIADVEVTVGVQGREDDQTGTELTLPLWEALHEGEDRLVVVVK